MSTTSRLYETDGNKSIAYQRLSDANVQTDNIAIPLNDGTKKCTVDFTQKRNRRNLSQQNGNYGILAKGRLHFIDLDDKEKAPDTLLKKTQHTFSISTPSDGGEHRYVVSDTPLPNIKRDWGEIRSQNQYVVGPGSSIPDYGSYDIDNDAPIQSVAKAELSEWIGGFEKETVEGFSEDIDIESVGGTAQSVLKELQSDYTAFFTDLMDRLNGGRGSMGERLSKESGKIDTSELDFVTLEHLYGVFREYNHSHGESRRLALSTYSHYSSETPFTKDGQRRKWEKRGKQYKIDMLNNAINQFDEKQFLRLLNQSNGSRRDFNEYSDITYKIVDFAIDWLTNDWDIEEAQEMARIGYQLDIDESDLVAVTNKPMYQDTPRYLSEGKECEYPSPNAIRQICTMIDDNIEETYRRAMKKMRKNGELKMACLKEGVDYRVYQSHLPDPVGAEHIRYEGKKYNPRASKGFKSGNVGGVA